MSSLIRIADVGQSGSIIPLTHEAEQHWHMTADLYGIDNPHERMGDLLRWLYHIDAIKVEPRWDPVKGCWFVGHMRIRQCDGTKLHVINTDPKAQ